MAARLDGLIKYHRWDVDEKRRILADLEGHLMDLKQTLEELNAQESREMHAATTPDAIRVLAPYRKGVAMKRDMLEHDIVKAENEVDAQRDTVADAFKSLKTYEVAHEQQMQREAAERDRIEQAGFDERALRAHRDQQNGR